MDAEQKCAACWDGPQWDGSKVSPDAKAVWNPSHVRCVWCIYSDMLFGLDPVLLLAAANSEQKGLLAARASGNLWKLGLALLRAHRVMTWLN